VAASELELIKLAMDICLSLEHPLTNEHPQLNDCPSLDQVVAELRKIRLATSA
jgi:hypothetical protein